jgi:hypothetical protein
MSTNLSKQKWDNLLSKISAIRTFISAAPQDENTGNLLTYLSGLERDVNGKKYGMVFEEHPEAIDTVLGMLEKTHWGGLPLFILIRRTYQFIYGFSCVHYYAVLP